MEILQQLLSKHGGELLQSLVTKAGFDRAQAQQFLPVAASKLMAALQGGGIDVGALLGGGGAASLLSQVDTQQVAAEAGVDPAAAKTGLEALAPTLLSGLKEEAGGAQGLIALLGGEQKGGLMGAAGKLAGKFFR